LNLINLCKSEIAEQDVFFHAICLLLELHPELQFQHAIIVYEFADHHVVHKRRSSRSSGVTYSSSLQTSSHTVHCARHKEWVKSPVCELTRSRTNPGSSSKHDHESSSSPDMLSILLAVSRAAVTLSTTTRGRTHVHSQSVNASVP